jgi:hypothetical protein
MSLLSDAQQFIEDLVLGDFAENPSSASIVVNGVIGLIPIVDQLLDIRDVTANVMHCSKKGWNNLDEQDIANLAFAAIGAIPEFGSFFKGAVKPLYKERKVIGRGVQSGIAMLERALGGSKGGALKWAHSINWASRANEAASLTQQAIGLFVQLLETVAAGAWWTTHSMEHQARVMLPQVKNAAGYAGTLTKKGVGFIEEFLKDLLGEHAVWVTGAMQVAASGMGTSKAHSTAQVSAVANLKANKARGHTNKQVKPDSAQNQLKDKHGKTGANDTQTAKREQGSVVSHVQQQTRQFLQSMSDRPMGLIAEHMVDHHVLKKHGGKHEHGTNAAQLATGFHKVNHPKRPIELIPEDLSNMFTHGIDSLWKQANEKYLVVEAKGRIGAPSIKTGQAAKDSKKADAKIPPLPAGHNLSPDQSQLWRMLHDTSDKSGGGSGMQMSRGWVEKDMKRYLSLAEVSGLTKSSYERRVYLVAQIPSVQAPIPAVGVVDHISAIATGLANGGIDHKQHEAQHGVSKLYSETDIAAVEDARRDANKDAKKDKPTKPKAIKNKPTKFN